MNRASVCILLREDKDQGLVALMMRRAELKGDPWSGHMSFPGGKIAKEDNNTYDGALRELHEETGLDHNAIELQYLGRLSDTLTKTHNGKRPMTVTPFVFLMSKEAPFKPNHEVAELLWIPLEYLLNAAHREKMHYKTEKLDLTLPCYFHQGQRIWGLSLIMLDELILLLYKRRFSDYKTRALARYRVNKLRKLFKKNRR